MSSWKQDIERRLHRAAQAVEVAVERGRQHVGGAFAPTAKDADHIAAYRGFATATHVMASGRVLANRPAPESAQDDSWLKNLGSLLRRICTREIAGAEVVLRYAGAEQTVRSDEEGYYEFAFERIGKPGKSLWTSVQAEVPGAAEKVSAEHGILTPPAAAEFAVISDLDDTVIHTGATQVLLMARQTLFGNARLRQPLAGVASLYRALQRGSASEAAINPLFYVSSSPWNLYDLLAEFLDHNDIPPGPLLLRDYGIDDRKLLVEKGHGHKLKKTERIMAAYPELSFVLIGDSGQDDAEIYHAVARRYPDRVRAIYIRDVDPDEDSRHDEKVDAFVLETAEHGVPMLRARDSLAMAEHATAFGLIAGDAVAKVAAEVREDEQRPATVEQAIDELAGEP